MEKSQKSGEGVKSTAKLAEEDEKKRERIDRLCGKRVLNSYCYGILLLKFIIINFIVKK